MNTSLTVRSTCVVALGGWAALASALSLGPVSGTIVIGKPLELIAPLRSDELGQKNGSGCVTAEGFYGDRVVDRRRVEVDLGADAARRAAAASLWRALNAQPQDLLRTAERLRGLEGEVNSLRSLSARHRAEIASARESLQNAQSQRHSSLLLVTLLALLAGSGAAFFWHRWRRAVQTEDADSWYGPLEPGGDANVVVARKQQSASPAAIATEAQPDAAAQAVPVVEGPKPVELVEPVKPAKLRQPAEVPSIQPLPVTPADPEPSVAQPVPDAEHAGLKVDALLGAQQQCEFFSSLGQVDEAVAVLTSYLEESSERPVLAFLELFRIYHGTGMRQEFEALQARFRQTFGMDVAGFSQYKDDFRELELFLPPVARIASAWPSERSLDIIEELLFKRPANARELLSLEAYRELMWLYALGQEVGHNTGSPAGLLTELSLDRLGAIDVAAHLGAFGVDIDLSAMRGDGQPPGTAVHKAQPEPTPAPPPANPSAVVPDPDFDAFDAAMGSQMRRP